MKARAGVRAALSSGANPMARQNPRSLRSSFEKVSTRPTQTQQVSGSSSSLAEQVKKFGGVLKLRPEE